jgi:hypothetical protein
MFTCFNCNSITKNNYLKDCINCHIRYSNIFIKYYYNNGYNIYYHRLKQCFIVYTPYSEIGDELYIPILNSINNEKLFENYNEEERSFIIKTIFSIKENLLFK